jgi:hypothetical protein
MAELYNSIGCDGSSPPSSVDGVKLPKNFDFKGFENRVKKIFEEHRIFKQTKGSATEEDAQLEDIAIKRAVASLTDVVDDNGKPVKAKIFVLCREHDLESCRRSVIAFIRGFEQKVLPTPLLRGSYARRDGEEYVPENIREPVSQTHIAHRMLLSVGSSLYLWIRYRCIRASCSFMRHGN